MKTVVLLGAAVTAAVVIGITVDRDAGAGSTSKPAPAASETPKAQSQAQPSAATISGRVREAFDVAGYTYLRLTGEGGADVWAAVSRAKVAVGSDITIADAAPMTNFRSESLQRTFPLIHFGNLSGGAQDPAGARLPPGHPELGPGHGAGTLAAQPSTISSPHAGSSAAASAEVKVPKASGSNARTIAELEANRATLGGKQVRVQGRVVKATPVQGVTYYRVRDGSAAAAELVVSSTAERSVGDVVTFEGQLGVDVDIGIGVKYPVMLQNAREVSP